MTSYNNNEKYYILDFHEFLSHDNAYFNFLFFFRKNYDNSFVEESTKLITLNKIVHYFVINRIDNYFIRYIYIKTSDNELKLKLSKFIKNKNDINTNIDNNEYDYLNLMNNVEYDNYDYNTIFKDKKLTIIKKENKFFDDYNEYLKNKNNPIDDTKNEKIYKRSTNIVNKSKKTKREKIKNKNISEKITIKKKPHLYQKIQIKLYQLT